DPLVVGVDVAVGDEEPPRMRPYRRVLVQPRSHLPGASQAGTLADKADQLGASEALLQLADPVVHLPEDALVLCCADGLRQGAQKLSPDPRLNQAQQGICRSWTRADARSGSRSTKSPSGKRTRSSARSSQAPTIAASTHTRSCASAATATAPGSSRFRSRSTPRSASTQPASSPFPGTPCLMQRSSSPKQTSTRSSKSEAAPAKSPARDGAHGATSARRLNRLTSVSVQRRGEREGVRARSTAVRREARGGGDAASRPPLDSRAVTAA